MEGRLKFEKSDAGHLVVRSDKGDCLGCVEKKGQIFKKRSVFQEDYGNDSAEWTWECLIELANKVKEFEDGISPSPQRTEKAAREISVLKNYMAKDVSNLNLKEIGLVYKYIRSIISNRKEASYNCPACKTTSKISELKNISLCPRCEARVV